MKKHLSLILRITVAVLGLGYIGYVLDWTDKIELPPGQYQLSTNQTRKIDKPTAFRIVEREVNPLSPTGSFTVIVDSASDTPGTITVGSEKLGAQTGKDFRLRPGLVTTLRHANRWHLLAGLLIIIPIYPITSGRWWMLMRTRGMNVPMWTAFRLSMVGSFFNYCMPGSTGGDLVKAYYAAKGSTRRADAVMTVIIDRVVGLLGLILLAGVAGLFIFDDPKAHKVTLFVWGLAGAITLGSAVYFSRHLRRLTGLEWVLDKLLPKDSLLGRIEVATSAYSNHKLVVFGSILASLPVHILLALSAAMAGWALGMKTPLGMLMTVIPVLFLVAALPISYQGFGLMEYFAIKLLDHPGLANANQIVVMLVLIRLFQVFYSLFGSIFLLSGDIHMHPEREPGEGEPQPQPS